MEKSGISRLLFIGSIAILSLLGIGGTGDSDKSDGVAVVELFTTEGCSSCPRADDLLKEMTEILQKEGKQVFPLAFHVTYFNHLGWVDPFSKEEFTTRQKNYLPILQVERVYTPQGVTNGEFQFIGSNPVGFRQFVEEACSKPALYSIDAKVRIEGGNASIDYSLNKDPKAVVMNIAVVQTAAERKILQGENKNRTLRHFNIVRNFQTIEGKRSDSASIAVPEDLELSNGSIILYLQHKRTMKVLGATRVELAQLPK